MARQLSFGFRFPSRIVPSQFSGIPIGTYTYSTRKMLTRYGVADSYCRVFVDTRPLDELIRLAKSGENFMAALDRGAEVVKTEAKRLVAVDTGLLQSKIESRGFVDGHRAIIHVGVDIYEVPYSGCQEWGTYKMPAHPYLRPAIDNTRHRVVRLVGQGISDDVVKAVRPAGPPLRHMPKRQLGSSWS